MLFRKMLQKGKLERILRQAGWHEGRDDRAIELEYREMLGADLTPEAATFVRSFGGLSINHRLFVQADYVKHAVRLKERVEAFVFCPCCPVAHSSYMGDDAKLWIDAKGRYYVVDSEGLIFVGEDMETALNVLLAKEEPPLAPEEIRESMQKGYEWDKI